jgi:cleavage stimulation factor subunit 2
MSNNRAPSKCVFIGNVAYDATKEELVKMFSEVGPVVNFRMVLDKDSGKPKGFAFCEYKDSDSALSARRNLDGKEFHGRNLRVDFADNKGINMPGESNVTATEKKMSPNETVGLEKMKEAISQVPKQQLYEAVAQMKQLVLSDPDQAKQIFRQNPTLGLKFYF